jgi:hypothetical protein
MGLFQRKPPAPALWQIPEVVGYIGGFSVECGECGYMMRPETPSSERRKTHYAVVCCDTAGCSHKGIRYRVTKPIAFLTLDNAESSGR